MPPDSPEPAYPSDDDVKAVLDEFGGDAHAVIRALLHDLDQLARDYVQDVSRGFVRAPPPPQRAAG